MTGGAGRRLRGAWCVVRVGAGRAPAAEPRFDAARAPEKTGAAGNRASDHGGPAVAGEAVPPSWYPELLCVRRCHIPCARDSGAVARDHITNTAMPMQMTDQTGAYGRNMKYSMANRDVRAMPTARAQVWPWMTA